MATLALHFQYLERVDSALLAMREREVGRLAHGIGASGIARVCHKVGRPRRGGVQGKNSDRRYWRETRWSTLNGANVRNNIK